MNPLLGMVLGNVFARAARRRGATGYGGIAGRGMGGGLGGMAMGGALAGMLGGRRGRGGRSALLLMLLPLAMQWVQRNGGLGAVLDRVRNRGYSRHANSWVGTDANEALDPKSMDDIVDRQELSRWSRQLGMPEDEVKQGFAELLPEMVNQLTPEGQVRPDADDVLRESIPLVEDELRQGQRETTP